MASSKTYVARRDPVLRYTFAGFLAVAIAAIGWVMITVGSSPSVKGASFIWLPAALQLVAGIWLGPWLGAVAGGLGAYTAGIFAYGGWGITDIIQNPIAGGFANAMLPALLFRMLRLDPTFGCKDPYDVLNGAVRVVVLALAVMAAGLVNIVLALPSPWGLALPLIVLVVGVPVILGNVGRNLNMNHFVLAVVIAVVACGVSALIGAFAAYVGGKPIEAALIDPGVGWFVGDTVSAVLGLFLLPLYTLRLRQAGIAE